MTHGSLRCEIPTLEPDDVLVDRLAELAAASRPSPGGVVVPVAFGGPAGRAVATAVAVAALTAGAAAAATELSHARQDEPARPGGSVGIHRPDAPPPGQPHQRNALTSDGQDTPQTQGSPARHAHERTPPPVPIAPSPSTDDGPGDNGGDDPGEQPNRHEGSNDPGDGDNSPGGVTDGGDSGDGDSGSSDSGSSDSGSSDSGSSTSSGEDGDTGGGGDGGGTTAGSGDGSGAGGTDPSFVLNGSAD